MRKDRGHRVVVRVWAAALAPAALAAGGGCVEESAARMHLERGPGVVRITPGERPQKYVRAQGTEVVLAMTPPLTNARILEAASFTAAVDVAADAPAALRVELGRALSLAGAETARGTPDLVLRARCETWAAATYRRDMRVVRWRLVVDAVETSSERTVGSMTLGGAAAGRGLRDAEFEAWRLAIGELNDRIDLFLERAIDERS